MRGSGTSAHVRASFCFTQTFSLYPDLTVRENLHYLGDIRLVPRREVKGPQRGWAHIAEAIGTELRIEPFGPG